jgi:hypothetical protein
MASATERRVNGVKDHAKGEVMSTNSFWRKAANAGSALGDPAARRVSFTNI